MLDIKMDLKQNFYDFIKREVEHLKQSGFEFPDNKKDDGYKIAEYFNLLERIPEQVPRKIYKCSSFKCPKKYQEALSILEDDIISGNSLFKYLSTNIFKASYSDGMQFDFGITHFHLGIKPHKKFSELVERTDDVLYCIFTYEAMYFIVIDRHGRWADLTLLEQIQREFPEVLKNYEMNVIELTHPVLSEEQRKLLREKHVNSLIQMNGKVYMSPGGGVATNGFSTKGEFRFINKLKNLSKLQSEMNTIFASNNKYFSECIPALKNIEFNFLSLSKPLFFVDKTFKYMMIVNWVAADYSSITIEIKEINPYK